MKDKNEFFNGIMKALKQGAEDIKNNVPLKKTIVRMDKKGNIISRKRIN